MRIDSVKAVAFGPFSGDTLELGPGMNVFYGPNESGKTSWHAAIYAALCGMRRARGQPAREDRDFSERYRPWHTSTWRVIALVTLDDGTTLELDQRLGAGGRSTATDHATKRAVAGHLVRDGAIDAATLLGLTRETALATIFVRQADVLRVLMQAGALQKYLERAAATTTAGPTATGALERITAYKREYVGLLRVGARGPLALAARNLQEARATLDATQDRYEQFQQLMARRRTAAADLDEAERTQRLLTEHEHERRRRDEWKEIRSLERRLQQATLLHQQIETLPLARGPNQQLAVRITRALTEYETRPAIPAPLLGPSANELEADLLALPGRPDGDLEPHADVATRRDALQVSGQMLAAHLGTGPQPPVADPTDSQTTDALEREIAGLPPALEGDVEPSFEVTTARDSWRLASFRFAAHEDARPGPLAERSSTDAGEVSAEELAGELAALPPDPRGDLEPNAEVARRLDIWHRSSERVLAHLGTKPVLETPSPPIAGFELRRLADELEANPPTVSSDLRREVERRRDEQRSNARHGRRLIATQSADRHFGPLVATVAGAIAALIGVLLTATGSAVPGLAGIFAGAVLAAIGLATRSRATTRPSGSPQTPAPETIDADLPRLEARLLLEEEATANASRRRDAAISHIYELQLPPEPDELRMLADASDAAHQDRRRLADWELRTSELESARFESESELRAALRDHGSPAAEEDLDHAYQLYVDACRERALQAQQAARRVDLEARLEQRLAADQTRRVALDRLAEWEQREEELADACSKAQLEFTQVLTDHGAAAEDGEDLDHAYQRYVEACRGRAQQAARRVDLEARLEQQLAADSARQVELERRSVWEQRRADLERACDDAHLELRAALADHGTAAKDGEGLDNAYQRYVDDCRQRAKQAAEAGRRDDLAGRLSERRAAESALDKDIANRAARERQLRTVGMEAGCRDAASQAVEEVASQLHEWLETNAQLETEHRKRSESIARLDQLLDGRTIETFASEVAERTAAAGDPPADPGDLLDRSRELDVQTERLRRARDEVAELNGQLEVAGGELIDVSRAIEAEARADAEVKRLTTLAQDLDRAFAIVQEAQHKVHADIAPVLNKTVRPWVPRITDGRYDEIRVDPATLAIEAHEVGGQFRSATLLSQGTTEQLFLLLRLALAEHLTTTGESAPVVLDDVTVQSDAQRTVAILDLLHELSAHRQVILFSQEDEVLRWAEQSLNSPADRLVRLPRLVSPS